MEYRTSGLRYRILGWQFIHEDIEGITAPGPCSQVSFHFLGRYLWPEGPVRRLYLDFMSPKREVRWVRSDDGSDSFIQRSI